MQALFAEELHQAVLFHLWIDIHHLAHTGLEKVIVLFIIEADVLHIHDADNIIHIGFADRKPRAHLAHNDGFIFLEGARHRNKLDAFPGDHNIHSAFVREAESPVDNLRLAVRNHTLVFRITHDHLQFFFGQRGLFAFVITDGFQDAVREKRKGQN